MPVDEPEPAPDYSFRHYPSDRGIPLIYNGPPPATVPILTMENYTKWYHIYAIMPSGEIKPIEDNEGMWWDHVPSPEVCKRAMQETGGFWDSESLEMIAGRCLIEHNYFDKQTWSEILGLESAMPIQEMRKKVIQRWAEKPRVIDDLHDRLTNEHTKEQPEDWNER